MPGVQEDERDFSNTSQESGFYSSVGQEDINQTFPRRRKDASRASVIDLHSFKQLQPPASISHGHSTSSQLDCPHKYAAGHHASQTLQPTFLNIKPLYFEVPHSTLSSSALVGRDWLYREMQHHLSSHLATNKGVIVRGGPGTGKTEVCLALVENSCFGRSRTQTDRGCSSSASSLPVGRPIHQGSSTAPFQSVGRPNHISSSSVPSLADGRPIPILSTSIVAYHFCQADNAPTCLLPQFVHSISAQMSQAPQLSPYFQLLQSDQTIQARLSIASCNASPSKSLITGILEPLNTLSSTGKLSTSMCIIVVDGLCEAEQHRPDYGDTLASFIAKHLHQFPSWLKIVCTVRSDMFDVARSLPFHQICLDNTDLDERLNKDLSDYISSRVNATSKISINSCQKKMSGITMTEKLTKFLTLKAKGCFLYVKLILDLIEKGTLTIKSSSFKSLPQSLSEIYHLAFNFQFSSSQSYEQVHDILSIALASLQPVSLSKLFNIFSASFVKPEVKWKEFQSQYQLVSEYLVARKDGSLMCFHPTLRDWLIRRKEGESTKFVCDLRIGHCAIAFSISRQTKVLKPEAVIHLVHHMLKANINKSCDNLSNRDIQAVFLALSTEDVSLALGCSKNIFAPIIKVSRLLLLSGANPNHATENMDHCPILGMYSYQGNTDMVSLLLEFGADVNRANDRGVAPLALASGAGNLDIVKLMVQCGAQINRVDSEEVCALVLAARGGHLSVLEYLLDQDWIIDMRMEQLGVEEAIQQALVAAISNRHFQLTEMLLQLPSININLNDNLVGLTPLCAASKAGDRKLVKMLLRRNAVIDKLDTADEQAPIHVAAREGHDDIVACLLAQGASVNQRDGRGRTALMLSATGGHAGLVELLVLHGAGLEDADKESITPLTNAIIHGHCEIAQFLLSGGANVNAMDSSGRSPLDVAVYQGNSAMVDILLENGANMEKLDIKGARPLDRVIGYGNADVVTIFLKKGAKLGPATWIMAAGKPEIQLILLNKLLEDGNTLYRQSLYGEAAHRYRYALKRLPKEEADWCKTFSQLNLHLLLNLSRSERKLGQFHEAAQVASQAISFQPKSAEAIMARGKANQAAGKFKEALFDFYNALRVVPDSREVKKAIMKLKEEVGCENMLVRVPISLSPTESMIYKTSEYGGEEGTKCNKTQS